MQFLVCCIDRLNPSWEALSQNDSLPWSAQLLTKYQNRWNWQELSVNEGIPWSDSLLHQFAEQWDWDGLVDNFAIPWTEELADTFIHRLKDVPYSLYVVSVSFADRHYQPIERYEAIRDVFSRKPYFLDEVTQYLTCFNVTQKQVRRLMAECFSVA